jgi:hypothetical protein
MEKDKKPSDPEYKKTIKIFVSSQIWVYSQFIFLVVYIFESFGMSRYI